MALGVDLLNRRKIYFISMRYGILKKKEEPFCVSYVVTTQHKEHQKAFYESSLLEYS